MRSERMVVSLKRFIGDAVMTVPLLDTLETQYEGLSFITTPVVAQVLHHPERKRHFLPLDTKRKPWEVFRAALQLRKHQFDIAVLVNHSFRSAVTIRLAGIPRRVGHATEGRNALLTDAIPYSESIFEAWSMLDLARPFGIEFELVRPRLPVTHEERQKGREVLQGATVGVQPGARFAAKMLPVEMIAEVCGRLQAQGERIAFLGAGEERESADKLAAMLDQPVVDLVGKCDIRGSLGALSHLRAMIGADTGLMHMAVATGCPTVTVFGPTPAEKWGHFYDPHQVILAPSGDMSKVTAQDVLLRVRRTLREEGDAALPPTT
jgi:heptosyltransferase II